MPDQSVSGAVAKKSKLPTLTVTKQKRGLKIAGAKNLRAGHVRLVVKGKGGATVAVAGFAKGYSFKKLVKDYKASGTGDMKALVRVFKKTHFLGGLAPGSSGSIKGMIKMIHLT